MANRDLIGRTLGEYVLHEPMGQGGGGLVYRSRQPTLNRDVVVKVMRKRTLDNSNARERFLREAQLASRLRHHYATHIYAFGIEPDGLRWIAMELVHGVTFDAWLRDHGPMSLEQLVPLLERVAEVVQAAHDLGIVHRDIKPSNIMVVEDHAGTLSPKLLDFGIAKAGFDVISPTPERWADGSLGADKLARDAAAGGPVTRTDPGALEGGFTPPGVGLGSAPYMSPEQQSDSASVGPAADIYSLALVAYQALHGHLPPPPAPRARGELEAPAVLDRIFARALARLPGDRHPTSLALAAEFRAALQASEREQLRASARQWQAGGRAPGLLWGRDMLVRFERWTRTTSWRALDADELAFVASSQLRARRSAWSGRLLIGLAVALVVVALGGWQLYTSTKAQAAEDQVTQLEVEQGRQALRDNAAEAKVHLANAYRRGDHSPGTTFMLARALQSEHAQLAKLPARSGWMRSARFSPDGQTIVTTDNESAQLWDARTYQHWLDLRHPAAVYDAVFSHDGKQLYTACGDGAVRVWSTATGSLVRTLRAPGPTLLQRRLAITADDRLLASIDIDGTMVTVWDLHADGWLASLKLEGRGLLSLEFTSDARWLAATGGADASIFDTQTWSRVRSFPEGRRLSVDPTGSRVVTGSNDGDVAIWSIPDGAEVLRLRGRGDPIERVTFSPDGRQLAAVEDGQLQVWDAVTGVVRMRFPARPSKLSWIEFSSDSRLIATTFVDGTIVLSDTVSGTRTVLDSSDGPIVSAHFAPDGRRMVSMISRRGLASVWSTEATYFQWTLASRGSSCRNDIPTDQRFLLLACPGSPTRVWDMEQGRLVAELPSTTEIAGVWRSMHAAVSPVGTRAAIARGADLSIYELPSAHLLRTIHHPADINVVAYAADGHAVVSGDIEGTMFLSQDDQMPVRMPRATAGIDAVGVLPARVIAASADRQIFVYDRKTLDLIAQRSMSTRVEAIRLSSDGARMATLPELAFAERGVPEVWDLNHVSLIGRLVDVQGPLFSVWFPNESHDLLTTDDMTVRRWDTDTSRLLQTYRGNATFVDATTTLDGAAVVALGFDGTLRFWDAHTGRSLWALPTRRGPVLELRRHGDQLLTIGADGEISGWRVPDASSLVQQLLGAEISCRDETRSSGSTTCHSP